MHSLKAYTGPLRKLVVAFDVGTTYSGVSYVILDPGEVPKILNVTRFPGQENGDAKIPSIIYYRPDGTVCAAGAETRDYDMLSSVESEGLIRVNWFKLHLVPKHLRKEELKEVIKNIVLPQNKSVVQVFADFLAYLLSCTKTYITETHPNGSSLWTSFSDRIDVILTHPNGWEGPQQVQMREAAVLAKLIPATPMGHTQLHFVTEGEASLHYCIYSGMVSHVLQRGARVMIVDAGGGTVDISTYSFSDTKPVTVEEVTPADCIIAGSTSVNALAQAYLKSMFDHTSYNSDIGQMLEHFEKSVKPTFKNSSDTCWIKIITSARKRNEKNIKNGMIKIPGSQVAVFFESSIKNIYGTICRQQSAASGHVKLALLVGGYAASPWLFSQLKVFLQGSGIEISRPDNHSYKPVANGAIFFYLQNAISTRVARLTYGIETYVDYEPGRTDHQLRSHTTFQTPSGGMAVPGRFSSILTKGTKLAEDAEVSKSFLQESRSPSDLNEITTVFKCYRGKRIAPDWFDLDKDRFGNLCTIKADTSQVTKQPRVGLRGCTYYVQDFKVVISCGRTELQAYISWEENGRQKKGPAKIVYDNDIQAA